MHGARPLRSTRRLQNLTATLPRWYNIAAPAGSGPTLVSIYDEIGMFGVAAAAFMDDLRAIQGDIELHINSPGGDVFDGVAIYNQLKQAQQRGSVHVIVDGLAASAASFIAQAASPGLLEMAPHSQMMIHDGFGMVIGNAADLRETADLLDSLSDEIASIYAERTGKPAAYWRDKMRGETWLTDKQAVAEGLADKIHGQDAPGNDWDLSVFAKYQPGDVTPVAASSVPPAAPIHDAMTGTHSHPDPGFGDELAHEHSHAGDAVHDRSKIDPDGDGDDDTSASGDTDHDYVEPDGSPGPKAKPGNRATAFPILAADVDHSPWDASKAWHNGTESDDPAAFYRGICAGRKAGDPSTQDAWALPYKYHPGDAPNAAGVRAALSRLPQTEDLTNKTEARSVLERAMKAINPDYDPDDHIDPELLSSVFSLGLEGAA